MIRRLKRRFILLSSLSLLALLVIILAAMNIMNYSSVTATADAELQILSENHGTYPEFLGPAPDSDSDRPDDMPDPGDMQHGGQQPNGRGSRGHGMRGFYDLFGTGDSAERPFQSRFFSVLLNTDGTVSSMDISRIASVDEETAQTYAAEIMKSGSVKGFRNEFRYSVTEDSGSVRVTFLDCSQELSQARRFLFYGALVSLAGFAVVFVVLFLLSGRIIRPIAEAYEKQKRFITDAGHEIRTPLSIIRANTDVLEMEYGQDESLDDIRHEIDRLTTLTKDLVQLSRMEEDGTSMPMIEFPLSDTAADTAEPFRKLFESEGRSLELEIQPGLSLKGHESGIRQLISILLDNARKYSPEGSRTSLKIAHSGGHTVLSVSNPTETEIPKESLDRVFDRFYRTDPSRSSATGGNGIGLSIARVIAEGHHARIRAATSDGHDFTITVTFPH